MSIGRIFHHHFKPIGTLIKSSPNQIAYLCDKEKIDDDNYFQITGFQDRCPSFMVPETIDWYFRKERVPKHLYMSHIDDIVSMIELANFFHMIQFGTIPNFYLGYIEKSRLKNHAIIDESFRHGIMYDIVFYTDFKSLGTSGVKLELAYMYDKKKKTFTLKRSRCSSDYRSNYYAKNNDTLITKINLFNAVIQKHTQVDNSPIYEKVCIELEKILESTRQSISINHPIIFDSSNWFDDTHLYPFGMDEDFCKVYEDKELSIPHCFKSHAICDCVNNLSTTPLIDQLDGVLHVFDPFIAQTYLKDIQFVVSNQYPDFNIYYRLNRFNKVHKEYLEELKLNEHESSVLNHTFNEVVSQKLLGVSIFDQIFLKTFCMNHPLASVVYVNATRTLINKIVDNVINKFILFDDLAEKGYEPVSIDEEHGKLFIKEKQDIPVTISTSEQIKNMSKEELEKYMDELLKNSPNNGIIN